MRQRHTWSWTAILLVVVLGTAPAAAGHGKHKGESKNDFGHLWRSCNHQMEGGVKAHGDFKYAGHSKSAVAFNQKENCVHNGGKAY